MLRHLLRCKVVETGQSLNAKWMCTQVSRQHQQLDSQADESSRFINPLEHKDYFGVREMVKMSDLFYNRVHLGHKEGARHVHMLPYIFGNRLGVDIIDLRQTLPLLHEALNFTAHIAYRKGIILFLSRHLQTLPLIEQTAEECGEYAHCRPWKKGLMTNATIRYGAITRLPDLAIFMSTHDTVFEQHEAIIEMAKMNIPTVGIVDSSCDPRLVTYPVPGNDDTPCAIELYCRLFKQAVLKGKAKRIEDNNDNQK